jgi:hypothetical protein
MTKASTTRVHGALIANPELLARLVEVLGEIHRAAGPFDGGDLTAALEHAKDILSQSTKGGGYGAEFTDHYESGEYKKDR